MADTGRALSVISPSVSAAEWTASGHATAKAAEEPNGRRLDVSKGVLTSPYRSGRIPWRWLEVEMKPLNQS